MKTQTDATEELFYTKTSTDIIKTLIDLMERDDRIQFGIEGAEPVTNGEWFRAINDAKEHLKKNITDTFYDMYRTSTESRQHTDILPDAIVSVAVECPACGCTDRPIIDAMTTEESGIVPQNKWTCPFCGTKCIIQCVADVEFIEP